MKRKILLVILLLAALLCSGCMNRQLEEQMLVIILGIDQPGEDQIRLIAKVPSNSADSGSSGGGSSGGGSGGSDGGEQMGYLLLEATGATFTDAMDLLSATTPRTLNYSQVREVVVGEEAAGREAFGQWVEDVYALPRMRSSATVVICRGEAKKFVEAQKPYVGIRLSRYIETTLSNYAGKGFVPTTTLGEVLRDLRYGFQDPLMVYGAVNDFEEADQAKPDNALDAKAGDLTRKSVNPIELFGAAATDGISVSGVLTGYEMSLFHLIQGSVQSLSIQENGMPVSIFARIPATMQVDLRCDPIQLKIQLLCEARYAPGYAPDGDKIARRLEDDLEKMIRHLQSLRCDGMGFGNIAVRNFGTIGEWNAFRWREQYEKAQVKAQVEVQLRKN